MESGDWAGRAFCGDALAQALPLGTAFRMCPEPGLLSPPGRLLPWPPLPSAPVRSVSAHQPVPSFSVNADLDPIIPLFRGPRGGSPCHPEGKPKLMRPYSVCPWPPPMPVHTVFSSVISPSAPRVPASLFLCPYPWHLELCSQIAAWLTPSNVLGLCLPIPSTKKPFLTPVSS